MVEETRRTLAYLYPTHRQNVAVERSIFQLAASTNELSCPCGKSSLRVELTDDRVELIIPCLFCGKDHIVTCPSHAPLHEKVLAFPCAASGLGYCYVGEEGPMFTVLQRLEEAMDEPKAASGGKGVSLGELVMQEVLSELKETAQWDGISCTCGSHRWKLQVDFSSIDLLCANCSGAIRISAATTNDIDDICYKNELVVHGQG